MLVLGPGPQYKALSRLLYLQSSGDSTATTKVSAGGSSVGAVATVEGSVPPSVTSSTTSTADDVIELDPSVIQAAIQAAIEAAVRKAVEAATNLGEVTKDTADLMQTVEVRAVQHKEM